MPRRSSNTCAEPAISEGADPSLLWTVLEEQDLFRIDGRILVSRQRLRLPDGRDVQDYLRVTMPSFASIFALTEAGEVICERQYKHGFGRVVLTLPAGSLEPGEAPLDGARRELLEETGHASEDWSVLEVAKTHANAGCNAAHMFLARGCRKIAEPDSGDLEDMTLEYLTVPLLLDAVKSGAMPLASDMATVLHALILLGALPQTP